MTAFVIVNDDGNGGYVWLQKDGSWGTGQRKTETTQNDADAAISSMGVITPVPWAYETDDAERSSTPFSTPPPRPH